MDQIYIVCLQHIGKMMFPPQLTMYFSSPPKSRDIVAAIKDTLVKYRITDLDKEIIDTWVTFFEQRNIDYYASDLKHRADVRNYTKENFKFSLSCNPVHQCVEETPIVMTIPSSVKVNKSAKV